jgi:hypothetical protein
MDGFQNPLHGYLGILVLPSMNDDPTGLGECEVYGSIALLVPSELGNPVRPVGSGDVLMLRAAVPEAPVDEHGNARSREYNVGPHPGCASPDPEILAEPEALAMQLGSEADLRLGPRAPVAPPNPAGGGVLGLRVGHPQTFPQGHCPVAPYVAGARHTHFVY